MTPQETIHESTAAVESGWAIVQAGGATYLLAFALVAVLVFGLIYTLLRLRDKDNQTAKVQGSIGINFQTLYDQQQRLIGRIEEQERQCQQNLQRTQEELEAMRLMVVRLRDKLFSKHVLTTEDQSELIDADQFAVPRR